jgi:hypothetical protein
MESRTRYSATVPAYDGAMPTPDRISVELTLNRLDAAVVSASTHPSEAGHSPAYRAALHEVLAGAHLLRQQLDDIPDGPLLGLVMCAMSLDVIATAAVNDRLGPEYFNAKLGPTLDNLRSFRARLDELWE